MTSSANVNHDTSGVSVVEFRPHLKVTRIAEEEPLDFDSSSFSAADAPRGVEFLIRLLDVCGALAILSLTFPVMLLAAALIKLTSRGGVFYRQERVGKNGQIFELYKFRTMIDDAEKHVGPVWAARDDQRITPVGRILRRTRLDELPQLYNILCGHMSLVGPRPERPFFVERHKALQGARLVVKPGLTGLAQVRSFYDLKPAHKVKYDYLYIQNRSLLLNLYILLRTVPVLFTKKGW
ncbi:MAG: sugar transferase [Phycisphaerales bacterium]|nr:MAG: sugar transferase [Phycisphaerales bacterium]